MPYDNRKTCVSFACNVDDTACHKDKVFGEAFPLKCGTLKKSEKGDEKVSTFFRKCSYSVTVDCSVTVVGEDDNAATDGEATVEEDEEGRESVLTTSMSAIDGDCTPSTVISGEEEP